MRLLPYPFVAVWPPIPDLINNLRNHRIIAFAIALVPVAQFAMVTHEVLAEHSPGDYCAACIKNH